MDDLLQQGITLFQAGKRDDSRKLFIAAIHQNPNDESAWGWMYNVCDNDKERIDCLKQVLRINPKNEKAMRLLNKLKPVVQEVQSQTDSQQPEIKEIPMSEDAIHKSTELQQNSPSVSATPRLSNIPGEDAVGVLRFFAWVDLITSIIGAIWVWVNFHEIDVPPALFIAGYTESNPIGIATGFGVLFQGILVFTLFLTIAAICENTIAIRKKLNALKKIK
jgi:tetratricopeptide (TPR) repeat protein